MLFTSCLVSVYLGLFVYLFAVVLLFKKMLLVVPFAFGMFFFFFFFCAAFSSSFFYLFIFFVFVCLFWKLSDPLSTLLSVCLSVFGGPIAFVFLHCFFAFFFVFVLFCLFVCFGSFLFIYTSLCLPIGLWWFYCLCFLHCFFFFFFVCFLKLSDPLSTLLSVCLSLFAICFSTVCPSLSL